MSEGGVVERKKNLLQIEGLASEAITTAVRGMLPVKQILQDYLGEDDDEVIEGSAVIASPFVVSEPKMKENVHEEEAVADEVKEAVADEVKEAVTDEVKEAVADEVKEAVADEVKEVVNKVVNKVVKEEISNPPAIVSIDTEQTVHFSDYDSVFDEAKGQPQIRYSPKDGDNEDEEESDMLTIDESTSKPVSMDDVEDLDAPVAKKDTIGDEEVTILE
jgi:hypothetical protein